MISGYLRFMFHFVTGQFIGANHEPSKWNCDFTIEVVVLILHQDFLKHFVGCWHAIIFTSFFSLPFMASGGQALSEEQRKAHELQESHFPPWVLAWWVESLGKPLCLLALESFGVCISRRFMYWYCCVSRRCIRGTQKRCYMLILSIFAVFFSCLFFFVDNRAPYDKHNVEWTMLMHFRNAVKKEDDFPAPKPGQCVFWESTVIVSGSFEEWWIIEMNHHQLLGVPKVLFLSQYVTACL